MRPQRQQRHRTVHHQHIGADLLRLTDLIHKIDLNLHTAGKNLFKRAAHQVNDLGRVRVLKYERQRFHRRSSIVPDNPVLSGFILFMFLL